MKKILVASILGIGLSVSQSRGQGYIIFDNYSSDGGNGAQITYGTGVAGETAGTAVNGFTAALYYELGAATADPGNDTAVPGNGLIALPGTGANAGLTPPYPTGVGNGYFVGPGVTIPGYTSGSVTFEIVAYNGSSYTAGNTTVRGRIGSFVETSTVVGPDLPLNNFANDPAFSVFTVPEPTTIALAGLGLAGLLAVRRRK